MDVEKEGRIGVEDFEFRIEMGRGGVNLEFTPSPPSGERVAKGRVRGMSIPCGSRDTSFTFMKPRFSVGKGSDS